MKEGRKEGIDSIQWFRMELGILEPCDSNRWKDGMELVLFCLVGCVVDISYRYVILDVLFQWSFGRNTAAQSRV